MSFGNEHEFIDYLQRKEGKTMKCPIILAGWNTAKGGDLAYEGNCLKEECAWWDGGNDQCALKTIANWLGSIANLMGDIKEKMPHEYQFRKV